MLKILGRVSSINVRKVLWTCDEIGIPYAREDWGTGFRSTKEASFQALNPKSLVPVVLDGDLVLTESNAICRYLAAKHGRADLLPVDLAARAGVELWMDWQIADLNGAWRYAVQAILRNRPANPDPAQITASLEEWHQKMLVLEGHLLSTSAYLCGEALTLADIVVGLAINRYLRLPRPMPALPAVSAYQARLMLRPAAMRYIGEGTD